MFFLFLQSCVRGVSRTRLRHECIYMPLRACTFLPSYYFNVSLLCISCLVFVASRTQLFPRPRASRDREKQFILQDKLWYNWCSTEFHF